MRAIVLFFAALCAGLAAATLAPVKFVPNVVGSNNFKGIPVTGFCNFPSKGRGHNVIIDPRRVVMQQNGVISVRDPRTDSFVQIGAFGSAGGASAMHIMAPVNPFNGNDHRGPLACEVYLFNSSIMFFQLTLSPDVNSTLAGKQALVRIEFDEDNMRLLPATLVILNQTDILTIDRAGACLAQTKKGELISSWGCGTSPGAPANPAGPAIPATTDPWWLGQPQNLSSLLGKLVRLVPNDNTQDPVLYSIPRDNPDPTSIVIASGGTQLFTCIIDPLTDQILTLDVSTTSHSHCQDLFYVNEHGFNDTNAITNLGGLIVTCDGSVCVNSSLTSCPPPANYQAPMLVYNEVDNGNGVWGTSGLAGAVYRARNLSRDSYFGKILVADVGVSYSGLGKPITAKFFVGTPVDSDDLSQGMAYYEVLNATNANDFEVPVPAPGCNATSTTRWVTSYGVDSYGEPIAFGYYRSCFSFHWDEWSIVSAA